MSSRAEKESFVSGHAGTSVWEIATVIVSLLAGYVLRNVLLTELTRSFRLPLLLSYLLDFSTLVLPAILVLTVLSDYSLQVCVSLLAASVAIAAYSIWTSTGDVSIRNVGYIPYTATTLPFVTALRTFANIFTAIAILAVDFPIFPRRFAKTESYGTGLMDIGVGVFMLAHGITSPEARGKMDHSGYVQRVLGTGRRVLPLLALGVVRLTTVKATDYQEHVTEYGVHWNFFFTIAVVRLLCTLLHPLISLLPFLPYASCSVLLASLHQLSLSWAGGTSYVLLGPSGDGSRLGLLSANREGVVSCVGYLAVYTGSIELGKYLFHRRKVIRDFVSLYVVLAVGVVVMWTLHSLCEVYVQGTSRRLSNLPFILWIVRYMYSISIIVAQCVGGCKFSQSFLALLLCLSTDLVLLVLSHTHSPPSPLPSPLYSPTQSQPPPLCVVSAIQYNQLLFFLLANLLTGLVNFSMDTLHTPPSVALCVLALYMSLLLAVCILLHRHSIKVKI